MIGADTSYLLPETNVIHLMGITATTTSVSSAQESAISLFASVGPGVGGVFVVAALLVVLAFYDVLDATGAGDDTLRTMLVAAIVPLTVTFVGTVLVKVLAYF